MRGERRRSPWGEHMGQGGHGKPRHHCHPQPEQQLHAAMLLPSPLQLHVDAGAAADEWPLLPSCVRRFRPPLHPRILRAAVGAWTAPQAEAKPSHAAPDDGCSCCCCRPCRRCCCRGAASRALGCARPLSGRPRSCMGTLALTAAMGIKVRWVGLPACRPSK